MWMLIAKLYGCHCGYHLSISQIPTTLRMMSLKSIKGKRLCSETFFLFFGWKLVEYFPPQNLCSIKRWRPGRPIVISKWLQFLQVLRPCQDFVRLGTMALVRLAIPSSLPGIQFSVCTSFRTYVCYNLPLRAPMPTCHSPTKRSNLRHSASWQGFWWNVGVETRWTCGKGVGGSEWSTSSQILQVLRCFSREICWMEVPLSYSTVQLLKKAVGEASHVFSHLGFSMFFIKQWCPLLSFKRYSSSVVSRKSSGRNHFSRGNLRLVGRRHLTSARIWDEGIQWGRGRKTCDLWKERSILDHTCDQAVDVIVI